MNIATIEIKGTGGTILDRLASITAGMVGATVTFVFSDEWAGFTKTAVFRYQSLERSVVGIGEVVAIPPEMLHESGEKLQVGVYGLDPSGQAATPSVWISLGRVQPGAAAGDGSGSTSGLPIWAQLLAMIGQIGDLETEAKNNLVAAVNELARRSSGLPAGSGEGQNVTYGSGLKYEGGVLSVDATDQMERDNTLPMTSKGVYSVVGNIEALLDTI